jgi:dTDP-4-dehydrorhamnose reductase
MRILVTGASGLVGGRLCERLVVAHDVVGVAQANSPPAGVRAATLDLTDRQTAGALLDRETPQVVIHCAAFADSERCERDPASARAVNVEVPRRIARACRERDIRLIAFSTDLVLCGEESNSTEMATPAPLSVYGTTKLDGERAILDEHPAALILRLALVCGRGFGRRATATEAIAAKLKRGETVTLYTDEWRSPIDADSIGVAIETAVARPHVAGLLNLAGPERITRLDFGERIASVLGLDAKLIKAAVRADHQGVPRPRDVSLDISRARRELDWAPDALEASIRRSRET